MSVDELSFYVADSLYQSLGFVSPSALPAGPFPELLRDLGVISFTARRGHVIRNFLKKGMGLSVP